MMRRFGLNFTETANMAGTYLDTLQNANLLGKMNDQQMRNGMEILWKVFNQHLIH